MKIKKLAITVFSIIFVAFTLISFFAYGNSLSKNYDAPFFIGLIIALLGYVMALVSVIKLDLDSKEKTFLRISVIRTAYGVSIVSVLFAVIYMFILPMFMKTPVWLGGVLAVLIIAFGVSSFVKSNTAIEYVEQVETKVKEKTFFIKSLTVDADALASKASTPEIKAVAKKVYEVIRYSDPMSNDKLAGVDLKIEKLFDEYQNAVNANDYELVKQTASALTEAVEERNKKCKLLK